MDTKIGFTAQNLILLTIISLYLVDGIIVWLWMISEQRDQFKLYMVLIWLEILSISYKKMCFLLEVLIKKGLCLFGTWKLPVSWMISLGAEKKNPCFHFMMFQKSMLLSWSLITLIQKCFILWLGEILTNSEFSTKNSSQ